VRSTLLSAGVGDYDRAVESAERISDTPYQYWNRINTLRQIAEIASKDGDFDRVDAIETSMSDPAGARWRSWRSPRSRLIQVTATARWN
jgi:hypothetical protein